MTANETRGSMDGCARLAQTLRDFRGTHPKHTLQVSGDAWEYISGGRGSHTIVVIPGGGGTAESMFSVNDALEANCRVVSLSSPSTVTTVEQAVGGIWGILRSIGVQQAILLGHSLGGMVVQAFAACHPERVAGLVLSNTGFYLGARGRILPGAARLLARAPHALVGRMVSSQMNRLLKSAEAADFWQQFYRGELSQSGATERMKQQYVLMAEILQFFRRNPISSSLSWVQSMPVQIIASEDDRGFMKRETEFLRSVYPRAQIVTFPEGTGHLSFLSRPQEYVDVVRGFIAGVAGSVSPEPAGAEH